MTTVSFLDATSTLLPGAFANAGILGIGVICVVMWLRCAYPSPRVDYFEVATALLALFWWDPYCVYVGFNYYFDPGQHEGALLASSLHEPKTLGTIPAELTALMQFQLGRQMVVLSTEMLQKHVDWRMLLHHAGFTLSILYSAHAYCQGFATARDILFFGGISELSTLVLDLKIVIGALNPKPFSPRLNRAYQCVRYTFLVMFLLVRAGLWNVHAAAIYYRFFWTWGCLSRNRATTSRVTPSMWGLVGCLTVMTSLQLLWTRMILRIAYRELVCPSDRAPGGAVVRDDTSTVKPTTTAIAFPEKPSDKTKAD